MPAAPIETRARRVHGALIVALAAAAGSVCAFAAANGSGPFASLHPHITYKAVRSELPRTPIEPATLFPAPVAPIMTKVVTVYDRMPAAPAPSVESQAKPENSQEKPEHEDSHPQPTQPPTQPTPPPDGGHPGDH